jgi:hypothetical protein
MADPPRLTQNSVPNGSKWEKRQASGESGSEMKANLKTWPATPVDASLKVDELLNKPDLTKLLCYAKGAAGVGRPSNTLPISNCQFPIGNA